MSKNKHTPIDESHNLRVRHARTSFSTELILLLQSPLIDILGMLSIADYVSTVRSADLNSNSQMDQRIKLTSYDYRLDHS